nr:hypothetical protein [Streptomyces albospinus]
MATVGECRATEAHRASLEFGVDEVHQAVGQLSESEAHHAAAELGIDEVHRATRELGFVESHSAPGECGITEARKAVGELCADEFHHAARELGPVKGHQASGKFGAGKVHRAAAEVRVREITAIEDCASEVEVVSLPGRPSRLLKVIADDANHRVTDLAVGLPCQPSLDRGWFVLVGHAQVGAKYVDAGLPTFRPVVGQPCQRVDSSQSAGGLLVPEQFSGSCEPLVEQA